MKEAVWQISGGPVSQPQAEALLKYGVGLSIREMQVVGRRRKRRA